MGCDIHGAVEGLNAHDRWEYGANVGSLVGRSYDAFGCLWGVRNSAQFEPLFSKRGFPQDRSLYLNQDIRSWLPDGADPEDELGRVDFHSASWATLEEIGAVDWDEAAEELDGRCAILDEDKEPTGYKAGWFGPASGWYDVIDENREAIDAGEAVPIEDGTKYLKRRELTRREALSGRWQWLLFDLMPTFRETFEEVRVVVWFDN